MSLIVLFAILLIYFVKHYYFITFHFGSGALRTFKRKNISFGHWTPAATKPGLFTKPSPELVFMSCISIISYAITSHVFSFQGLDYFSTECIYSPNAYRGYARAYIKDLEQIRPSTILDIIHSGEVST